MVTALGIPALAEGSLVVYSPNSDGLLSVIPLFEEQYGVKVEIISAGTGDLMKRLQSEQENPYADVLYGGAMAQFAANKDLFQDYVSPEDVNLLPEHQNKVGYATNYVADGSVLLINPELLGDIKVEGYADLLNPALKGKIATADPAASSSAFCQLTNMLLAMGGYESDEAWAYVAELFKNIDGKILGSSSAVHKGVVNGEYAVALTYEDPSATYIKDGATNVQIVYPVEGTVFLAAQAGVVKGAKNLENAKKFVDFVISQQVQDIYGTTLTNRPLRNGAKLGTYMKPMEEIRLIFEDSDYVISHKQEIVDRFTEIISDL
jgi:iron(III) transport system substrate-binding protein